MAEEERKITGVSKDALVGALIRIHRTART